MSTQPSLFSDDEVKKRALADLVRLADAMEQCEPGSAHRKALARDYKHAMIAAGITDVKGKVTNAKGLPKKQIDESRAKALAKIKGYLDNLEESLAEFKKIHPGEMGHILISYNTNSHGVPAEVQLKVFDSFYKAYSGYRCGKCQVTLFTAKQIKGYASIHRGLLEMGMGLLPNKPAKKEFFDKYVVPYNQAIEEKRNQ